MSLCINIGALIDVPSLAEYAATLPNVVEAQTTSTSVQIRQKMIQRTLKKKV